MWGEKNGVWQGNPANYDEVEGVLGAAGAAGAGAADSLAGVLLEDALLPALSLLAAAL